MANYILDIGLTGLIFGTMSFILTVVLYVFVFIKFKHTESDERSNNQISVARLASTCNDGYIDITNPPLSIDNTLLSVNDIVLLKNQKDCSNGLYRVCKGINNIPYKLSIIVIPDGCLVRVRYGEENQHKIFTLLYEDESSGKTVYSPCKKQVHVHHVFTHTLSNNNDQLF